MNMSCVSSITDVVIGNQGHYGYVVRIDDGPDEIVLGHFNEKNRHIITACNPRSLTWRPGGEFSFLSAGPVWCHDGHKFDTSLIRDQVWTVGIDGKITQVTSIEPGVVDYDWSPSGSDIVIESISTDEQKYHFHSADTITTKQLYYKFDGRGWFESIGRALFILDESGTVSPLDQTHTTTPVGVRLGLQPSWGDRGIAFVTDHRPEIEREGAVLRIIDPVSKNVQTLTDGAKEPRSPVWSPTGERIAFVKVDITDPREPTTLMTINLDNEQVDPVNNQMNHRISDGTICWGDRSTIYALIAESGATELYQYCVADGSSHKVDISRSELSVITSYAAAGKDVLCSVSSIQNGETLIQSTVDKSVEPSRGTESCVRHRVRPPAELLPDEAERINWKSTDGKTINGYLYCPADSPPYDMVVSVHGGPVMHTDPRFSSQVIYWVNHGYCVFEPNYRGSTSYGREFGDALTGQWNDKEVADILSGVSSLVENGVADSERLFAHGRSHGGTIIGYLLAETDRFTAAATEHSIFDFRSAYGTTDSPARWEREFGLPWENQSIYKQISPITFVDQIDTPLLLIAGGNDQRTPLGQAEQMYTRLARRLVPTKLVVEPEMNHAAPTDPEKRREEIRSWFNRFGTRPESD